MSTTTTQLLSGGEFCKLRYDTTPVKSATANVSFYTCNSEMPHELYVNSRYLFCRSFVLYVPDNGDLSPKHKAQFTCKDD